ncbi:MAG: hypothetical protein RQ862_02240 [Candidatus Caldarchaeales archaeon]|nr:hypothetical protein [Candidatus Caldarchaeales archaeon]
MVVEEDLGNAIGNQIKVDIPVRDAEIKAGVDLCALGKFLNGVKAYDLSVGDWFKVNSEFIAAQPCFKNEGGKLGVHSPQKEGLYIFSLELFSLFDDIN